MTTSDKNNKTTRRDRLRQLKTGIQLHLLSLGNITIGGVVHVVTDIVTAIDADIAKSDAAEKGHAAWLQQVDEERASHEALDPILSGVKQYVRLNIGDTEAQQAVLADFGMTPHKKRVIKPKTRVDAAAKAKATRTLLQTRGSKQKKAAKAQASPTGPAPAATPATGGTVTTTKS
jgi:hypothetical protein